MPASPPRWVRPCLLGMLILLGASLTWAVARAQGPFGPPVRPPIIIPNPRPFQPPQPPNFGPNPGNPFGQRPGIGPQFPNIQVPHIESVWTCSKCGREVARGNGSHPPAQCPFCGTRLINGFGPPNGGPGVQQPVNPGFQPPVMPPMPPVVVNPPIPQPNPGMPINFQPVVPLVQGDGDGSSGSEGGSGGTLLLIGGIGMGILALGLVGAGLFVFMNSKKQEQKRRARKRRLSRALDG